MAEVEASEGRTEEASEGDSFEDIMGSLDKETGGESEGFTFADLLQPADLLSETVLEGVVDTPDLPMCWSSFFIFRQLLIVGIIWWPSIFSIS